MNIDLMNPGSDDPPHYVVSPSNEYEAKLLVALYGFHRHNRILMTEKPEDPPRPGPLTKGNKATGEVTVLD